MNKSVSVSASVRRGKERSVFQRTSISSRHSHDSETDGPAKQTFTKTAIYKVRTPLAESVSTHFIRQASVVALKRFYKTKLETTRALQLEVKTVK